MKKIILLFIFVITTISCQSQKANSSLQWKEFDFPDAGLKVSLPCEPKKYFKSFQDNPRPIHVYDFSCETEGMKFLVSSKNYMDDFNENTFKQTFDANESNLKTMFGAIESIEEKNDFLTNGLSSKYYEVTPKVGGKVKSLIVVNNSRFYEAMFGITPESERNLKESKVDYNEISKKFLDSFQITDNK